MRWFKFTLVAAVLFFLPACDNDEDQNKDVEQETVYLDHCPSASDPCTPGQACSQTYGCDHCSFVNLSCRCTAAGTWSCSHYDDFSCIQRCEANACLSSSECTDNKICYAPSDENCGACYRGVACDDDEACVDGQICAARNQACMCNPNETQCVSPCDVDAPCPLDGDICIDGRCQPQSCADTYCTQSNFVCNAEKICVRETCGDGTSCKNYNDHCVKGHCYNKTGKCSLPVP